jgi:hypothetical protein
MSNYNDPYPNLKLIKKNISFAQLPLENQNKIKAVYAKLETNNKHYPSDLTYDILKTVKEYINGTSQNGGKKKSKKVKVKKSISKK